MPAAPVPTDRGGSGPTCRIEPPTVDRAVELAVILPLEVGARLLDAIPATVDKVPATVARVRQELVLARFIGKLAVDQGAAEVKRRLSGRPEPSSDARHTARGDNTPAGTSPNRPTSTTPATPSRETGPNLVDTEDGDDSGRDAAGLALADYDQLAASQVVAMLAGLTAAERDAIEVHERRGRHRRTILGKLEQLREASA
jgi:hypothetical protein